MKGDGLPMSHHKGAMFLSVLAHKIKFTPRMRHSRDTHIANISAPRVSGRNLDRTPGIGRAARTKAIRFKMGKSGNKGSMSSGNHWGSGGSLLRSDALRVGTCIDSETGKELMEEHPYGPRVFQICDRVGVYWPVATIRRASPESSTRKTNNHRDRFCLDPSKRIPVLVCCVSIKYY